MVIKNVRVIDPKTKYDRISDIYINKEKIVTVLESGNKFSDSLENDVEIALNDGPIIDGTGLVAAPGLIDVHVHFRDPGLTYKEDINTGAKAAVKGGYTTVIMMANTKPSVDNIDTLDYVINRSKEVGIIVPLNILPAAAVTKGLLGEELTDAVTLIGRGAAGLTDDGIPIMNEALLEKAFNMAASLNVPISLHEENPNLISENGVNAGRISESLGFKGSPKEAEISMIARDLPIALKTGADVNIQHISTKEGVELVRKYKQKQINDIGSCHIHAEATPHHFSLTEEAVLKFGTLAKMNPPLRTKEDRLAIIEGLQDGTIDIIATDHAPHSKDEKARDFAKAPSGIIGLETALSLGITNLVDTGKLTLMELMEKMSLNPAKLYGLMSGIEAGNIADIVIFDPDGEWIVDNFCSKSENSPFVGERLKGVVKMTICGGRISYSNL